MGLHGDPPLSRHSGMGNLSKSPGQVPIPSCRRGDTASSLLIRPETLLGVEACGSNSHTMCTHLHRAFLLLMTGTAGHLTQGFSVDY